MILNKAGKSIRYKKETVQKLAVVSMSLDMEIWHPLKGDEVPEPIKNPDIMACMLGGEIVSIGDESGPFYKAQAFTPTEQHTTH